MSGDSSKILAFNYFGSKFTHVENLIINFPSHLHFVDVFCGSMTVILNKKKSRIDTANDINGDVINFFKVLREQPQQLIDLLQLTPVSREEFNNAWDVENCSDLERARRFYVRSRQSLYGLGTQEKNKGWHSAVSNSRCHLGENVSRWLSGVSNLKNIVERLREIQIENRDYKQIINQFDDATTFFYLDPPYLPESRSAGDDYKHDFSKEQHHELSYLLHLIKGKAMISGYDCQTMKELYSDWRQVDFPIKRNNIRKTKVVESIWMNYSPENITQKRLF
jgi:DNA adenine methylase